MVYAGVLSVGVVVKCGAESWEAVRSKAVEGSRRLSCFSGALDP